MKEQSTAPQVRSLFKPASWMAKIDFINHLVLFNNVLITVLSEKSGGKTSFGTLLLNNIDSQIKPVFMHAQAPCERGAVLQHLASQLHLNLDAHASVASIVAQINERKAHVLFVIDEAQNVPEELIKELMIAIKNQADCSFFHLCILSDYSMVASLNNLAADQFHNLVHTIEVGDLNESETRTYVLQRAMAAHLINKPLTDNQLKQFYQLTKGHLAKINSTLESFIFKCAAQNNKQKNSSLKKASLALAVITLAGVSVFYLKNIDFTTLPAHLPEISSQNEVTNKEVVINELPSYIPKFREEAVIQLVHNALPKKQILDGADEEQEPNTVALVDKVIVIPSVSQIFFEREIQLAAREGVHGALPNRPVLVNKTQTVVKNKLVAQAAHSSGYTIQLAASHSKNDIYRFKQSSGLYAAAKVRHFKNQNGSWYILTMGEFNTRAQAQEGAKKLPSSLAKLKPWVRSITGLKNLA